MTRVFEYLKLLKRDEDGAVTVDWVVLSAFIVGLGTAAASVVQPAIDDNGGSISTLIVTATQFIPD